jgi:hypothetical protein
MALSLLLVLAVSVQEPAPSAPKPRTTVLHLADGRVLRLPARAVADGYEVQRGSEWVLVPAASVTRAVPERELLQRAAEHEREVPRGDLVRRVAYADWLEREGLEVEALRALDRVLAEDPDQADALALLARAEIPLALPRLPNAEAELEAYFASVSRLEGAARELAVRALGAAPEVPGLRAALGRELVARANGRRAFATVALRRLFPGSEAEALLGRAVLDGSSEVRTSAALALKAFSDPVVIAPALRALDSKHAEVRINAATALAHMSYPEAVEPLFRRLVALQSGGGNSAPHVHIFNGTQRSYVQDFDVEVAQGQAIADPIINILIEGSVLDVAVLGVSEQRVTSERAGLRRALSRLTGANPGETTAAWEKWWQEHGDEWQAGATPRKAPTSPAGRG